MTDIPHHVISKAKEIYESNWPDPILAIAQALMQASNTTPAQKAGERGGGLKPCPFCGGNNLEFKHDDIDGWIAHVACRDCDDMLGPMSEYKYDDQGEAADDAAQAWNRRADDPQFMSSEALAAHIAELQLVLNEKREIESL